MNKINLNEYIVCCLGLIGFTAYLLYGTSGDMSYKNYDEEILEYIHWLWGFISNKAAFFSIHTSRGKKVLRAIMNDFKNILISDRYAAYNIFDSFQRQLCWAHLKRDFTKLSEKDNQVIARIGKDLLQCEANLFRVWHEYKAKEITRDEVLFRTEHIRQRVGE